MSYDSKKDTKKHIALVQKLLYKVRVALKNRGKNHDKSKLRSPEKEVFDEFTPKLKGSTYLSHEYVSNLNEMQVALDHHYASNRHHPEFFLGDCEEDNHGLTDSILERMSLIDIMEMLIDWKAASVRHKNGNILKSIELNQKRFGYSDEWKKVFLNTIHQLEMA